MSKKSILNLLSLSKVDVLSSEQSKMIVGGCGRQRKAKKMKHGKCHSHRNHCHSHSSSSSSTNVIVTPPIVP